MPINILAVILVAIVCMAVGFVWYSMQVFGKAWMKETKISMDDMKGGPSIGYLFTTVSSIVMAIVMTIFVNASGTNGLVDGAILGFFAWLGFVATSFTANYVFSKKSLKLFAIDAGYFLVTFILAGAIVAAWK